jgi:hypothetical protein
VSVQDTCQSVHDVGRTADVAGPYDDTWQFRTGHVAAPERDTCQADLAFLARTWTNPGVTRVTTGRVTRGTDDVSRMRGSDDVALRAYVVRMTCTMTWQMTWANQMLTRGIHWLDVKVPRGPITGCHVAPQV